MNFVRQSVCLINSTYSLPNMKSFKCQSGNNVKCNISDYKAQFFSCFIAYIIFSTSFVFNNFIVYAYLHTYVSENVIISITNPIKKLYLYSIQYLGASIQRKYIEICM